MTTTLTLPQLLQNPDVSFHLLGFLKEEHLASLEASTKELWKSSLLLKNWVALDRQRGRNAASPLAARRRGIQFARAVAFARSMERVAAEHYNYGSVSPMTSERRKSRGATRGTVGECRCEGCPQFQALESYNQVLHEYQPECDAIFVRLSHRHHNGVDAELSTEIANSEHWSNHDDSLVLWQGFVLRHDKEEYRNPFHRTYEDCQRRVSMDATQVLQEADWSEVRDYFLDNPSTTTSNDTMESFEDFIRLNRVKRKHFEAIASNLQVTVVVLPFGRNSSMRHGRQDKPKLPQLLMATGGFWFISARDHSVYLQPRDKRDHHELARNRNKGTNEKVGNLEMCLSFSGTDSLIITVWDRSGG